MYIYIDRCSDLSTQVVFCVLLCCHAVPLVGLDLAAAISHPGPLSLPPGSLSRLLLNTTTVPSNTCLNLGFFVLRLEG